MRKLLRRVTALIEGTVMTIALMSGMVFTDDINVSAATDGKLTLNVGTKVVSDGSVKTYSFTAPKKGEYYFFTESSYDLYGELSVNGEDYDDGDDYGDNENFRIYADLEDGDVCEILVEEHDSDSFECTLFVCDEAEADKYVGYLDSGATYWKEGETCTLTAEIRSMAGNYPFSDLPSGYSIKWYKNGVDLQCDRFEYNLNDIVVSNFNDDNYISYECYLYKENDESYEFFANYYVYDALSNFNVFGGDRLYISEGDSVILQPIVVDYNEKIIDLKDSAYAVEWYKYNEDTGKEEYVGNGASYEIESVIKSDCYLDSNKISYRCDVSYKNVKHTAEYYIYDLAYMFTASGMELFVSEGNKITLQPDVEDYYGEKLDVNGSDFDIEWYRVNTDTDEREYIGKGSSYTIESVSKSDFYDDTNISYERNGIAYVCSITYKGEENENADFYLYNRDYYLYSIYAERVYTSIGESKTLEVGLRDYWGQAIDLSEEVFTFEWYKMTWDGYEEETGYQKIIGTNKNYEIKSVEESDLYRDGEGNIYVCKIYKNSICVAVCDIYLRNNKDKDMNKLDGQLVLNEGKEISENGEYVFMAQEDGTYYFVGADFLWKGGEEYYGDGNRIEINLFAGDRCIVPFSSGTIYVYDETEAGKYFSGLKGGGEYYSGIGEKFTLEARPITISGEKLDKLPDGYSVKWYKVNDGKVIDLQCEELGYIINSVDESDYDIKYDDDVDHDVERVWYECCLYENGVEIDSERFSIYDKESGYYSDDKSYVSMVGESAELVPDLYDYKGDAVDLSDEEYSFEWYKVRAHFPSEYGYKLAVNTPTYKIDKLKETDFCYGWDIGYDYVCKIYKNGTFLAEQNIRMLDKEKYVDIEGRVKYEVTIGEPFEIKPVITDCYGNMLDPDDERFYVAGWYIYTSNGSYAEYMGSSNTCTIDSITSDHIWGDRVLNYFECWVYDRETGKSYRTEYHLINKNWEDIPPIVEEPETTTPEQGGSDAEETTTQKQDGSKVEEITTPEQSGNKVEETTIPSLVEPTTQVPITSAVAEKPTTQQSGNIAEETTTTANEKIKVKSTKVKYATKNKLSTKKLYISLKKVKDATKYQIQISTTKKFKKKLVDKSVKKVKFTIKSKKIKNKKKLFVRVRVCKVVNGKKYYSKWSKAKKVKIGK